MKKCRALALPGLAAFVMVLAACATVDVTTTQYLGAPRYQPTEPNAVQILRTEPTAPHDRLGEVMVGASVDPQPVAAYVSGPGWGRSIETISGRKVVAVAIRYQR
jgi:hypothetical protein